MPNDTDIRECYVCLGIGFRRVPRGIDETGKPRLHITECARCGGTGRHT